jgi:hypothetical protein
LILLAGSQNNCPATTTPKNTSNTIAAFGLHIAQREREEAKVEPCHHRRRLTEVPAQMDGSERVILVHKSVEDFVGMIVLPSAIRGFTRPISTTFCLVKTGNYGG